MTDDRIRLQKYLSMCAVASRRKAEELIAQGKVKVNGKVAQIGDKVSPKHDTVTVGGRKLSAIKSIIISCCISREAILQQWMMKWAENALRSLFAT